MDVHVPETSPSRKPDQIAALARGPAISAPVAYSARRLTEALGGRWRGSKGGLALCPAHDDHRPSLEITQGDKSAVVFVCRAGCEQSAIIDALKARGFWPNGNGATTAKTHPKVVGTWQYVATDGTELRKKRFEPGFDGGRKSFIWEHRDGDRWLPGLGGKVPRLYRYDNVEAAGDGDLVLIVKSEASADILCNQGWLAIATGGSTAWRVIMPLA